MPGRILRLHINEDIIIGGRVVVRVCSIGPRAVRLLVVAPDSVSVTTREEAEEMGLDSPDVPAEPAPPPRRSPREYAEIRRRGSKG